MVKHKLLKRGWGQVVLHIHSGSRFKMMPEQKKNQYILLHIFKYYFIFLIFTWLSQSVYSQSVFFVSTLRIDSLTNKKESAILEACIVVIPEYRFPQEVFSWQGKVGDSIKMKIDLTGFSLAPFKLRLALGSGNEGDGEENLVATWIEPKIAASDKEIAAESTLFFLSDLMDSSFTGGVDDEVIADNKPVCNFKGAWFDTGTKTKTVYNGKSINTEKCIFQQTIFRNRGFCSWGEFSIQIPQKLRQRLGDSLDREKTLGDITETMEADTPELFLYKGHLQAKTAFSDGAGTPADAFACARFKAKLDFFAVTEHSEYLFYRKFIRKNYWNELLLEAEKATVPGKFVAFAGYQVDIYRRGAFTIIGTEKLLNGITSPLLSIFYHRLKNLGDGAVATFCHPGESGTDNFNSFKYYGDKTDSVVQLIRVDKDVPFYEENYIKALDAGWHVGPESSQDNHTPHWGLINYNRTGVWAQKLERAELLKAFKARRTFSANDINASLIFKIDDELMGGKVEKRFLHQCTVIAADENPFDYISKIQVIGQGGKVFREFEYQKQAFVNLVFRIINPESRYYWIKVIQNDSGTVYSAPIWIE